MARSASCLIQPRTTCPGVILLTVDWALPHPSLIRGYPADLPTKLRFLLPRWPQLFQVDKNWPAQWFLLWFNLECDWTTGLWYFKHSPCLWVTLPAPNCPLVGQTWWQVDLCPSAVRWSKISAWNPPCYYLQSFPAHASVLNILHFLLWCQG